MTFDFPCELLLAEDKTSALPVGSKALGHWNSVCLGSTPPAEAFTSSLLFPFFQALFFLLHSWYPPFSFILCICPIQNPQTFLYLSSFFSLIVVVHCVNPDSPPHPTLIFCSLNLRLPFQDPCPVFLWQWEPRGLSATLQIQIPPGPQIIPVMEQHCWARSWYFWVSWRDQMVPDHFSVKRSWNHGNRIT